MWTPHQSVCPAAYMVTPPGGHSTTPCHTKMSCRHPHVGLRPIMRLRRAIPKAMSLPAAHVGMPDYAPSYDWAPPLRQRRHTQHGLSMVLSRYRRYTSDHLLYRPLSIAWQASVAPPGQSESRRCNKRPLPQAADPFNIQRFVNTRRALSLVGKQAMREPWELRFNICNHRHVTDDLRLGGVLR